MTNNFLAAEWPAPDCIVAGTTTRKGGFSSEPYDSFNLASHVDDNINNVIKNRNLLVSTLNLPHEPHWLNQVHGVTVIDVKELNSVENKKNCADAVICFDMNKVCAVLTADCIPILITDKIGSRIAAIHAGWRGLRDGIIEQTISQLNSRSKISNSNNLLVWIGPAISRDAFEVDDVVRNEFVNLDADAKNAYIQSRPGHWNMDLILLAKQRLNNSGIKNNAIFGGNYCSYFKKDLFFSYRRDNITGRMASLIYIRNI